MKTWNIRSEKSSDRFDWMRSADELAGSGSRSASWSGRADEVYALFNNNRDDYAPRSTATFRGLLDSAGIPATGGIEPPPLAPTLF